MQIEVADLTGAEAGSVAITAAEGGIGYWSRIASYQPSRWTGTADDVVQDNIDVPENFVFDVPENFVFYRIAYANPTGPGVGHADITPKLLNEGLKIALTKRPLRSDLMDQLTDRANIDEVDSDAADCLVQLGVFGEVVFG